MGNSWVRTPTTTRHTPTPTTIVAVRSGHLFAGFCHDILAHDLLVDHQSDLQLYFQVAAISDGDTPSICLDLGVSWKIWKTCDPVIWGTLEHQGQPCASCWSDIPPFSWRWNRPSLTASDVWPNVTLGFTQILAAAVCQDLAGGAPGVGHSAKNGAPLQIFFVWRRVSGDWSPHQADAILSAAFRSTLKGRLLEQDRTPCHWVAALWFLRRCSQARCQPYASFLEIALEHAHTIACIAYMAYQSISPGHNNSGGSLEDGWRVEGEPRELKH